ncbi:MAG: S41 family peptidase [Bacteroidota bacterium]
MKTFFSLLVALLIFSGCQSIILGKEKASTPEHNFELFWQDFDEHYGLFTARGWDWDSIYTEFHPRVTAQTTEDELWEIFKEMITYLDDSHTFVARPGEFFASGSEDDEQVEREFSLDLILNDYVELIDSSSEQGYWYGRFRDRDIGYLYLSGIDLENPAVMDEMLRAIGQHAAIIIDIRNNTGGDDLIGAEIAGRFLQETTFVYSVQERNGPEHDDFAGKTNYYARQLGTENFTKPVVLLTDLITVSAGEVMTIYLKANSQLTQIGTTTAGDFSDTGMHRFLPMGWIYQYSIMKFLLPDGTSLDGVGHIPDIYVRNTEADIAAGNDVVLARAFDFLWEEYNIR